ncbi:MAG TPA: ECF transporter S component [Candidatus Bariatricus faecipullorum]|nr:ECF transporter S component [Candidatus Bariatricus faecipullorum]
MSTDVMTKNRVQPRMSVKMVTKIGMLGALSTILMLFEIPLPFAPSFYELDFSEVPVLIGAFAMGPAAGALTELVKILLNFIINGTDTAGVGELANFLIGCSLCIPASVIYRKLHTRTGAIIGMLTGTVLMAAVGCVLNAYVLLPAYSVAFQMPLDALVAMGTAVNSSVDSLLTFVLFAVAPFNLLKGVLVSAIVFLIYKKISPILKMGAN